MKTNPYKNQEKEDLIQKLIELVFKKAKKESKETKAYGLSRYLNKKLKDKIAERTLTRYYDGYILNKESDRSTPDKQVLNLLSEYLGYDSFINFEVRREYELEKLQLKNRLLKLQRIGLIFIVLLLAVSITYIIKDFEENCMVWTGNQYVKADCCGAKNERPLDEVILKNFKKVEVCSDSLFFDNGIAVKYYLKMKNKVEIFTHPGEHPIHNGKSLKSITNTIIDKYVKPCDSINK